MLLKRKEICSKFLRLFSKSKQNSEMQLVNNPKGKEGDEKNGDYRTYSS